MKFTIKTIGCKVNAYESNKIKTELLNAGLIFIDVNKKDSYKDLDYYIINTCSVTSIADKKSRQMIHQAKAANKNLKIVATGCYDPRIDCDSRSFVAGAQAPIGDKEATGLPVQSRDPRSFVAGAQAPHTRTGRDPRSFVAGALAPHSRTGRPVGDNNSDIDLYISNKDKSDFLNIFLQKFNIKKEINHKNQLVKNNSRIREFIKIQDGCNQYCTYCIIPFLRGSIKSRDVNEIIEEIKEKVKNGTKEIVLTGIHLSSFGLDKIDKTYESEGAIDIARKALLDIIIKIANINIEGKEVERIRLGSLEPRIIDDTFILALNEGKVGDKFCANFCLSLQSGSDKILKAMNRHYTTMDFERACDTIRKYLKDATVTTDVIVGFPGESDKDYKESLDFVKKMKFYNPNIFPYSRRPGTKADAYENQISNAVKHERTLKMIAECEKITKEIEKCYDIDKHPILVEEVIEEDGKKYGIGYTKEYIKRKVEV